MPCAVADAGQSIAAQLGEELSRLQELHDAKMNEVTNLDARIAALAKEMAKDTALRDAEKEEMSKISSRTDEIKEQLASLAAPASASSTCGSSGRKPTESDSSSETEVSRQQNEPQLAQSELAPASPGVMKEDVADNLNARASDCDDSPETREYNRRRVSEEAAREVEAYLDNSPGGMEVMQKLLTMRVANSGAAKPRLSGRPASPGRRCGSPSARDRVAHGVHVFKRSTSFARDKVVRHRHCARVRRVPRQFRRARAHSLRKPRTWPAGLHAVARGAPRGAVQWVPTHVDGTVLSAVCAGCILHLASGPRFSITVPYRQRTASLSRVRSLARSGLPKALLSTLVLPLRA